MKKAIISGSKEDYLKIIKELNIKNSDLILWKPDFSSLLSLDSPLPIALGDNINKQKLDDATKDIHSTLESWYRDQNGNDLSVIDGCSYGLTFESSLELLFYNLSLTYLSIVELSKTYDEIIIENCDDPVKIFVCNWLKVESNIPITIARTNKKNDTGYKLIHPMLGFRDLNNHFHEGNFLDFLFKKILMFIQKVPKNAIYIMNSGKLEGYIENVSTIKNSRYKLLIPITRKLKLARNHIFYWKRFKVSKKSSQIFEMTKLIENLGWNCKTTIIPNDFFKESIQYFSIPFWQKAFNYFEAYKKLFKFYKPKVALFGSDSSEIPLISAYAAKRVGIKTMMMPHGIPVWGGFNMHKNLSGPFDYYGAIGKYDAENYFLNGVPSKNIQDSNLPWFSRSDFKHHKMKKNSKVRNAMLLPLDTGFSLHLNANTIHRHLLDMIEVCNELDIEIFGIKFRNVQELESFGFKIGKNNIMGQSIEVFGGYGDLSNYFKHVDTVIGPVSSATAECSLANIDYYTYHDYSIYSFNPNIYKSIKNILHLASNKTELINNITQSKIFQDRYSKEFLVNIDKDFLSACKGLDDIFENISPD